MARPYVNIRGIFSDSFLEHRFAYEARIQQTRQQSETKEAAEEQRDDPRTWTIDGVCVAYVHSSGPEYERIESRVQIEFSAPTPETPMTVDFQYLLDLDVEIARADSAVPVGDLGVLVLNGNTIQGSASRRRKKELKEPKQYICWLSGAVESPE